MDNLNFLMQRLQQSPNESGRKVYIKKYDNGMLDITYNRSEKCSDFFDVICEILENKNKIQANLLINGLQVLKRSVLITSFFNKIFLFFCEIFNISTLFSRVVRLIDNELDSQNCRESSFKKIFEDSDLGCYFNKKTRECTVIRQAPSINRLVISGGGAKGAILPGAIKALEEKNVLKGVEEVAGSSVGAMTAAFIAAGMTAAEMEILLQNMNFHELLGKGSLSNLRKFGGLKKAEGLHNFIKKEVKQTIEKRLSEISENADANKKKVVECYLNRVKNGEEITFSFLHELHQNFKGVFKDLTVTATEQNTGKVEYMNVRNCPGVSIATACRASAALPIYLTPVKSGEMLYVDGGLQDNVPVDAVHYHEDCDPWSRGIDHQYLRTLVIVFSSTPNGQWKYRAVASKDSKNARWTSRLIRDMLPKWFYIQAKKPNTQTNIEKKNTLRKEYSHNLLVLSTAGVGTFSFGLTVQRRRTLCQQGYQQALQQLELFQQNKRAVHHVLTLENLKNYLNKDQYQKVQKVLKTQYFS